ncbi:hypothetical protein SDC9_125516 [bioreactor metagenome]|uniref:Uncharacterized protein n=1 Tax=bioreactor metagenome TaxID=1076179 RepID=A0A645CNN9_9ZZZZ
MRIFLKGTTSENHTNTHDFTNIILSNTLVSYNNFIGLK